MDNDALDSVDQFQRSIVAVADRLGRLAPAAIQNGIRGGNFCAGGGVLRSHDADQDIQRGPRVAARQRSDFSDGLSHFLFMPGRIEGWNAFTRRGVGVIHGQVIGPWRQAKRDRRRMHRLSLALEPWNECNDFRAHDNASHTAIATRPARASDIK
jgi:hypothetical protein